jgi:hypothetical protein
LTLQDGSRLPTKAWAFFKRTSAHLLVWIVIILASTLTIQWIQSESRGQRGGTELTGAERTANLSQLNDASSDGADSNEQSNKQNFALAYDLEEAKVDYEIFLNPDCSPAKNLYLYLREKPAHGSVRIDLDANYSGYESDSQRYKCNLLPSQSPSIFYRRNKGFVGQDHFAVEVFEPSGYVRTTHYTIDAR